MQAGLSDRIDFGDWAIMAEPLSLSKRSVEGLAARDKDYIVFDAILAGFGIRVMPSGKRFFLIQYRKRGRTRRVMLGQFGPVTAELARREATRLLAEVRAGDGDPAAARDADRQAITMDELGKRFLREHVETRCKPSTRGEYRRSVELYINPFCGKERARRITSADVAELHGILAKTPYQANRVLGVLSKMMNLAEVWRIRPRHSNPCEDVEKFPEHKRERFLSSDELKRLGEALAAAEQAKPKLAHTVAAYRLLLLTGCRLGEIQTLKWSYVDFERNEFRLPDSKTGAKTVHFGPIVGEVLKGLKRVEDNPFVIVGNVRGTHITDLQHPWRRIRADAGLDDVRIHDLRHTFASGGLLEGEGLPMIGKLLGHTQVQTTARYAHLAADPVKRAAGKISDRLANSLFGSSRETPAVPEAGEPTFLDLIA